MSSLPAGRLRRVAVSAAACIDTLILSREGLIRKKVALAACSSAVGDIVLYGSTLDFTSGSYPSVNGKPLSA